jgi:hypothetical protein
MISCYRHPSSWQRRSSFCVSCSYPHQTIGPLLLAPAPTIHPHMDEASSYLAAARNLNGCCSRAVRTGRRACPLTATTHHASPTDQTANIYANGSHPAGASGKAVRTWRQARLIVQPETLLAWHHQLFRLFWRHKSQAKSTQAKVAAETMALIKQLARDKRRWGAERIRVELPKLDLHVCKRTIQKDIRHVRTPHSRGQSWATFRHSCWGDLGGLGPAISCTSLTCASGRSVRFSSWNCHRGRSSTSG